MFHLYWVIKASILGRLLVGIIITNPELSEKRYDRLWIIRQRKA